MAPGSLPGELRSVFAYHSAIVDFCELNYTHSTQVVEWWGTLSAFVIVAYGAIGAYICLRHGLDTTFVLLWSMLTVVGFGTAYLHATLAFFGQMTDELPMLLLALGLFYVLFTLEGKASTRSKLVLAVMLAVLGCSAGAFMLVGAEEPLFFRVCFGAIITGLVMQEGRLYYKYSDRALRRLYERAAIAFPLGFGLWLIDMHACSFVQNLPINPQLHAWWHIFTGGVSCHYTFAWVLALNAHIHSAPLPSSLLESPVAAGFMAMDQPIYGTLGCPKKSA